jgi:hypothetical protein
LTYIILTRKNKGLQKFEDRSETIRDLLAATAELPPGGAIRV